MGKLLQTFLDTLDKRGELIPGGAARLAALGKDIGDPARQFSDCVAYLAGAGGAYLTPDARKAMRATDPLEFVLTRYGLRPSAARRLQAEWACGAADAAADALTFGPEGEDRPANPAEARARSFAAVARFAAGKLHREDIDPQTGSPTVPYGTRRVTAILDELVEAGFLARWADTAALAQRWPDLASRPERNAITIACSRLRAPEYAHLVPEGGPASGAEIGDYLGNRTRDAGADAAIEAELRRSGSYQF